MVLFESCTYLFGGDIGEIVTVRYRECEPRAHLLYVMKKSISPSADIIKSKEATSWMVQEFTRTHCSVVPFSSVSEDHT